ncbi:unnamed protein product [Effrenium voratum]|uniref:EF-hand domain-containing protein n=1 Tax=Effrenium voratum TaxID=2562239 RepID=A0AA36NBG8_9DINO|nr:unnamed protein product [Effrenium voratum]
MKFEELLEEVDVEQKNQLTKQDFLVFMRKIRERDTQYIRDYFRECDTDGEPGLDAKEIATLIESLGHVPDMACVTETLQQLNIENPEEETWTSPRSGAFWKSFGASKASPWRQQRRPEQPSERSQAELFL